MHNLFNNPRMFNSGTTTLVGWNNAVKALLDEINKLTRRFRETSAWVTNTHSLVKLLKSDSTLLFDNADVTLEKARNRWISEASLFGISTPFRRAAYLPENIAYPSNVREYLVMDDSIPLGNEIKLKWQQLEPIKVLDHPYSDLNLSIPNGKFQGTPIGDHKVYISINVPVLILQYRLWQKYEASRNGIEPDSPHIFLVRYPLFNIIKSHMDIVLRNRFVLFYNQQEPQPFKRLFTNGVAVNDVSNYVDRALRHAVTVVSSGKFTFDEINQQIPQLSYENVSKTLLLPEMSYTRSVRWIYDASRLNWLSFLIQYNNDHNVEKNRADIDYLKRRLKVMKTDSEFYENFGIGAETTYGKLSSLLDVS